MMKRVEAMRFAGWNSGRFRLCRSMAHPNRPASPSGLRGPPSTRYGSVAARIGGLAVACAAGGAAILAVIALAWPTLRLRGFLAAGHALPAAANGSAGALGAMPCGAAL